MPGISQAMLRRRIFNYPVRSFRGLNTIDTLSDIEDGQLTIAKNFIVSSDGGLRSRPALNSIQYPMNLPAGMLGDLHYIGYYVHSQTVQYLATSDYGAKLWKLAGIPGTWTQITLPANSFVYSGVQYNDAFYMSNYNAGVPGLKYDGTSVTTLSGMPGQTAQIFVFKDRLWWIDPGQSKLYYSQVAPAHETLGGTIQIAGYDGGDLMAGIPLGDHLVLFKTNKIWNLFLAPDPAAWSLRLFYEFRGASGIFAVTKHEHWIYFKARDGVFRTDGVNVTELTAKIRDLFKGPSYPTFALGPGNLYWNDAVSYFDKYIFVAYRTDTDSGNNNIVYNYLCFSTETGSWTTWDFSTTGLVKYMPHMIMEAPAIWNSNFPNQTLRFVSAANMSGTVPTIVLDSPIDDSLGAKDLGTAPFNLQMRTKAFDFGIPYYKKRCRLLVIGATGSSLYNSAHPTVSYLIDQAGPVVAYSPTGNPGPVRYPSEGLKVPGAGYFREFQIDISDNTGGLLAINTLNMFITLKDIQNVEVM